MCGRLVLEAKLDRASLVQGCTKLWHRRLAVFRRQAGPPAEIAGCSSQRPNPDSQIKLTKILGSYKQADDCPEKSLYVALVLEKLELGYHLYTKVKLPLSRIMKLIKNRSQPPSPFPFLPIFFPYRHLLRRLPIIEAQGFFSEYVLTHNF